MPTNISKKFKKRLGSVSRLVKAVGKDLFYAMPSSAFQRSLHSTRWKLFWCKRWYHNNTKCCVSYQEAFSDDIVK